MGIAEDYRRAWSQRRRNALSNLLQGYGEELRRNVTVTPDRVVINVEGYRRAGRKVSWLMHDFMVNTYKYENNEGGRRRRHGLF